MLDKNGVRQLCYIVKIDDIQPIVGSDNCEAAIVGGWHIMTRKGTFKTGDLAVYFEIDSKVPETEEFKFLESKHYKIKTQKYTPIAVRYSKEAINTGIQTDMDSAIAIEANLFGLCFASEDQKEGMGAFLKKEAPQFKNK